MATATEQWVLVEMVQALYEVTWAALAAPTTPGPGAACRVVRTAVRGGVVGWPRHARTLEVSLEELAGHWVPVAKCMEGPAGADSESLGLSCERGARPDSCLGAGRKHVGGGPGERLGLRPRTGTEGTAGW